MKKMKQAWKRLGAIVLSSALLVSVMSTLYIPIGEVLAVEKVETEVASSTEEMREDSVTKEEKQTNETAAETASLPEGTETEVSVEEYAAAPKAGEVVIDSTNFPDENFRKYVQDTCDKDKNSTLSQQEIDDCTTISISYSKIKSLEGIEFFTSLRNLSCSNNYLDNLDLSKNTVLTELDCGDNYLSLNYSRRYKLT